MQNSIKLAACYIRVSTDDQTEHSPESQLSEIQKYAEQHNFYIPDEYIFKDEGISGRNADKRPEFQRMISIAKKKPKPFDAVLLWKFSRFARNKTDAVVYKNMLRKDCGIDVISISENVGEDRGTAVILESLFEAMDEYYSINLSTEVTRSMKLKAERGEPNGPAPFGYLNKDKTFIPDPERAETVRYIFSAYASGIGMRKIATELNEKGIRTKRGNLVDNRFVEYILTNPVYIGYTRWSVGRQNSRQRYKNGADEDTIIAKSNFEPLVDEKIFNEVKELISQQKKRYKRYQRPESNNEWALRGLLRCDCCGSTLVRISTKSPSAQCHSYAKGVCHTSHSISLSHAQELVISGLEAALSGVNFKIERTEETKRKVSNAAILNQALESEKRKLQKVREAYEEGVDTIEEYKYNKLRINKKIAELEKALGETKTEIPKTDIEEYKKRISDVIDTLKDPSQSEKAKNETLRSIVDRIVFHKPENNFEIHFYA